VLGAGRHQPLESQQVWVRRGYLGASASMAEEREKECMQGKEQRRERDNLQADCLLSKEPNTGLDSRTPRS